MHTNIGSVLPPGTQSEYGLMKKFHNLALSLKTNQGSDALKPQTSLIVGFRWWSLGGWGLFVCLFTLLASRLKPENHIVASEPC